ncbi:Hypothetical predicted protein, partial [Scomber scombrus]
GGQERRTERKEESTGAQLRCQHVRARAGRRGIVRQRTTRSAIGSMYGRRAHSTQIGELQPAQSARTAS